MKKITQFTDWQSLLLFVHSRQWITVEA